MKNKRYTKKEIDFLRKNYQKLNIHNLTIKFNGYFNFRKTYGQIKSTLANHKITCGRIGKNRLYRPIYLFNEKQINFVKQNCKNKTVNELTEIFNKRFNDNKKVTQIKSCLKNRKILTGFDTKFKPGEKVWNEGTKGLTKSNSGSFKKGVIPANVKPIGHERICKKSGMILIKVAEKDQYTEAKTRYKHKHIHIWEQIHGPVPKNMVIIFKDGKTLNCTIKNLIMITRAELLRLNQHGYKTIPDELKPSVFALTKLETKIFATKRKNKKCKKDTPRA